MGRSSLAALSCAVIALTGCANYHSYTAGEYHREAAAGIAPGESVAVVIKSHLIDEKDSLSANDEQAVAHCIEEAASRKNARLVVAKAGEPVVRYVVDVEIVTTSGVPQTTSKTEAAGGGGVIGWNTNIEQATRKTSVVRATVHDLKLRRLVGTVASESSGDAGQGVNLAFSVIPVPYFFWAPTESRACQRFGEELTKLLAD